MTGRRRTLPYSTRDGALSVALLSIVIAISMCFLTACTPSANKIELRHFPGHLWFLKADSQIVVERVTSMVFDPETARESALRIFRVDAEKFGTYTFLTESNNPVDHPILLRIDIDAFEAICVRLVGGTSSKSKVSSNPGEPREYKCVKALVSYELLNYEGDAYKSYTEGPKEYVEDVEYDTGVQEAKRRIFDRSIQSISEYLIPDLIRETARFRYTKAQEAVFEQIAAKDYSAAARELERIIAEEPTQAAYYNYALLIEHDLDFDGARENYRKAGEYGDEGFVEDNAAFFDIRYDGYKALLSFFGGDLGALRRFVEAFD